MGINLNFQGMYVWVWMMQGGVIVLSVSTFHESHSHQGITGFIVVDVVECCVPSCIVQHNTKPKFTQNQIIFTFEFEHFQNQINNPFSGNCLCLPRAFPFPLSHSVTIRVGIISLLMWYYRVYRKHNMFVYYKFAHS